MKAFRHIASAVMSVVVVKICSSSNNFYMFGRYRNPALSDKVFDCLLTAVAKVRSFNSKASFLFVGDVNAFILRSGLNLLR